MTKIRSAEAAARLIGDGAVVAVSSSSGLCCPDAVLAAIGARFEAEGVPRGLTTIHPIPSGDMFGIKGVDHIARPGLLARIIGGSYPSGPTNALVLRVWPARPWPAPRSVARSRGQRLVSNTWLHSRRCRWPQSC